MDGIIQYLDEEAEESWEQVCKYHGSQKKWRTYKIQRYIPWGTKDDDYDEQMRAYINFHGVRKVRRCNSEPTFLYETMETMEETLERKEKPKNI